MSTANNNLNKTETEEKEIDLLEIGLKLWNKRKLLLMSAFIGILVGIIIAFSIPKEYTTTVIMAPEAPSKRVSRAKIGNILETHAQQDILEDAISPQLYPDIVNSSPFLLGLLDTRIKSVNTTLYNYLKDHQKSVWWNYIISIPSKLLNIFPSHGQINTVNQDSNTDEIIILSNEKAAILGNLRNRIHVSVDKKSGIITLTTTMQSPEVSAYIARIVTISLQDYIIDYRTQKARQDLIFMEKQYEEAKANYCDIQKKNALYLDKNMSVVSSLYLITREQNQNEMELAYEVYNQMAKQLEIAKMNVQDITPAYTVIQPAEMPLAPAKPNKRLIVVGSIFLSTLVTCGWILVKELFAPVRRISVT